MTLSEADTDAILAESWPPPDAPDPIPTPRKCRRHEWPKSLLQAINAAQLHGDGALRCLRCGAIRDTALVRRNVNNRKRGKSTSAELAHYLGWQNVEGMNWKWDIQGKGGRIQSKRDATGRSGAVVVALIEAIPAGTDYLRGLYRVAPRQRLASGTVTVWLREWVDWHGWLMPPGATLSVATEVPLIEMPLPTFRDIHGGTE